MVDCKVCCKICEQTLCRYAGTQRGLEADCRYYMPRQKPRTNADRIRAMSDEELADLLDDFGACSRCRRWGNDCFPVSNTLDWLRQPVKDGDNA